MLQNALQEALAATIVCVKDAHRRVGPNQTISALNIDIGKEDENSGQWPVAIIWYDVDVFV